MKLRPQSAELRCYSVLAILGVIASPYDKSRPIANAVLLIAMGIP
jgi:hypothetical protein